MGTLKIEKGRDELRADIEAFLSNGKNDYPHPARALLLRALHAIPRDRDMVFVEEYEQGALDAAFKKVQNPNHWKDPIDSFCNDTERDVVHAAIVHFTGTVPEFHRVGGTRRLRVTAIGYRMGPCGDH